jgi:hypothetical protein
MTDEELLASAMRKAMNDENTWIEVFVEGPDSLNSGLVIDGGVSLTRDEAAACLRARDGKVRGRG